MLGLTNPEEGIRSAELSSNCEQLEVGAGNLAPQEQYVLLTAELHLQGLL